ncbi:hypothetical protein ACLB1Q_00645 [Escherichia coli]
MLYAKGANVTSDKGIIDFLNQYEEAVKVNPRSPQEMIDEAVQTAKQSDVVVAVVGEARGWRTRPPAVPILLFRKANVT